MAKTTNRIGDQVQVVNINTWLQETKKIDGVIYELYDPCSFKDARGIVRVYDEDSGEPVSITTYRTYEEAEAAYNKAITIEINHMLFNANS